MTIEVRKLNRHFDAVESGAFYSGGECLSGEAGDRQCCKLKQNAFVPFLTQHNSRLIQLQNANPGWTRIALQG